MHVQRLTHLFVRMDGYAYMPVPCKCMGQNSLTRLTRLALRDGARRMCVMQYAFETGATRKSNAMPTVQDALQDFCRKGLSAK